ncbi:hypothetical protein ACQ4PT_012602 [Festuca glaucescens]
MGTFPHRRLMDLSRWHGPLMFLMLGEVPAVVVSSAEGAEAIMRTKDLAFTTRAAPRSTSSRAAAKGVIFTPYGDHWRQMRKICVVELFSARQVKRMESVWAYEEARLVRSVAGSGGGVVNFSETMYPFMNDLIARAVFGGRCAQAQQAEYLRGFSKAIELAGGFLLVDLFPSSRLLRRFTTGVRQLTWSFGRIQHIIGEIITARRALRADDRAAAGDQDLLDVLLNLQEEGSLPIPLTAEIIGVVISPLLPNMATFIAMPVVFCEFIAYMFNEDTFSPLYQSHMPYVSNFIADDDHLWKITGDVFVELLWDLEHIKWITRDFERQLDAAPDTSLPFPQLLKTPSAVA